MEVDCEAMWTPEEGPGLEYLHLRWDDQSVRADGVLIRREDERTIRVRYEIRCDASWCVREARVTSLEPGTSELQLMANGAGRWSFADGRPLPELEGCRDLDLRAAAFTNTLAIRRLRLRPGDAAEISVAYVTLPTLQVVHERQRYTCLEARTDGALYRYEGVGSGFTAEVTVDHLGIVTRYPGLAERTWFRS